MEKSIFDSKLYRAVYNSYQALEKLEKSPVTIEGARKMEEVMEKFRKSCEAYLAKREGPRQTLARTGIRRLRSFIRGIWIKDI